MFLSQDYHVTIDWFTDEVAEQLTEAGLFKDWSTTLVFEQVIPALKEGGMTDEQLSMMLEDNPRRWLSR